MRQIVQISTVWVPEVIGYDGCGISQGFAMIYAVCADGTLWVGDHINEGNWRRVDSPSADDILF